MKYFLLIPLISFSTILWSQSDTNSIKAHMTVLTQTAVHRNYENIEQLNEIADYLHAEFSKYADTVYFQSYFIGKREYKNVIASFGTKHDERVIVGAHYDVCGEQEGADDNASGTVGLLELARQLDTITTSQRIDLVAYTLEEPPFFRSEYMGSYIHAQSLVKDSVNVKGMICLEMIGYFADERKTQDYPLGILKLFYGSRGNYITLVNQFGPGKFARKFTKRFKHKSAVKAKQFKGPKSLPGIDFSDHLNYWQIGISALMITDTAFYRNKEYHQKGDTMDRLDYARMAQVIDGVFVVLTDN
ncbi:MAG: peptidase M28 [Candidatus Fluviicola riflensis]|nr:MAG: peptidase M28 [Candidatus Fluviicola riflensis]OGS80028.1 MAG: peptidase M28 [Candidatus Fluviicola riflensis]OGS82543.1 MAG: peptidase M28 [Fluviicola sp. RIFCSPHIGHO2_01_FULL_43_53]OGS88207.1 MAG: peptidase M28 [Fluviicola sp. RIFCSPHIGHO2_12_FULL_43_24]